MAVGRTSPAGSGFVSSKDEATKTVEHSKSVIEGNRDIAPVVQRVKARGKMVTIEFIEDGLTSWGRVWTKGRTVTVRKGGASWKETCDRSGANSWLELDAEGQLKRWRKIYFRRIPTPDDVTEIKEPRIGR